MATVTFFFADQAGSTAQLERLGDAGAKGVRQALIDMLRQAAEDHHGQVVDHTGDGLMLAFDSAVDAVSCGVVVQQQAARHNTRHPEAEALGVRVGIHTGEPLVNDEGRWFGVPVVIAARLCAAADTGQVLVSDVTRALVAPRRAHAFTALGERALKGIADPVAVAAVDWAPEEAEFPLPEALAAAAAGPFVGRAAELAWLDGLWEQVGPAGGMARRRVALLAGDPGIGKTRLVAAFAAAVFERDGLVLYGRCDEEPTGPYQPLVEALGPYVATVPRAELRQQLGPAGGVLTRVLPELAERVPHLAGPARLEPETEPYLVAEAAEAFLVAVARTTPTLLVLDDLHWADTASLLVVRQLARGNRPGAAAGARLLPRAGRRPLPGAGRARRRPPSSRPGPAPTPDRAAHPRGGRAPGRPDRRVPARDAGPDRRRRDRGQPVLRPPAGRQPGREQLTQQVGRAARRAETTRLDLRGVREELVAGVLELQRVRDRPPGGGQGPEAEGHAGLLVEAPVEADGTPPVPTPVPTRAWSASRPADAGLFHGREQLVAQLVARLVAARFVAVVGPCGSGKSSLVRAGLLPTLAGGALPGSDTWVPVVLAPGADPLGALAERLAPLLPGADPAALAARLAAGPDALDQVAAEALAGRPETARLLLVVDQFEEVFTACRDEQRPGGGSSTCWWRRPGQGGPLRGRPGPAGRLLRPLRRPPGAGRRAGRQPGPGRPHDRRGAAPGGGRAGPPGRLRGRARSARDDPGGRGRRAGCPAAGLHRPAGDLGAAPGPQPHPDRLRRDRRGPRAPWPAWPTASTTASTRPSRRWPGAIFLRLTEPGEGVDDLRRRARREELGDDPVTDRVLGVLVARRLVIADQDTVEVAHEALLREWPRLRAGWRRTARAAACTASSARPPPTGSPTTTTPSSSTAAPGWPPPSTGPRPTPPTSTSANASSSTPAAPTTNASSAGPAAPPPSWPACWWWPWSPAAWPWSQRSNARRQEVLARSTALAAQASARRTSRARPGPAAGRGGPPPATTRSPPGAGCWRPSARAPGWPASTTGYGRNAGPSTCPRTSRPWRSAPRTARFRLWDFRTRSPRTPPIPPTRGRGDVTFSPDGRLLATTGDDGWSRLVGRRHRSAPIRGGDGHEGVAASARFSPDGKLLPSSGSRTALLRLW